MVELSWALKEWAIAVNALLSGDLILLIRKRGIRESKPFFEVPSDRALLFPTYEHQSIEAIQAPYQRQFTPQPVPTVGTLMELTGWAHITHQLPIVGSSWIERLQPFHIWTDAWLAERLAWKPDRPAYGLLLRAYRFAQPITFPYKARYGGCRSWINIDALTLPESKPVLSEAAYTALAAKIQQAIASNSSLSC